MTDSIDTENLSTRGRSVWVRSSQVRLLDNSVPHNSLPERMGPLGLGMVRAAAPLPRKPPMSSVIQQPVLRSPHHDLPLRVDAQLHLNGVDGVSDGLHLDLPCRRNRDV